MSCQDTTPYYHLSKDRDHTPETSSSDVDWAGILSTSIADCSDDTSSHFNREQGMRYTGPLPDHRLARVVQSSSQLGNGGCRTSLSGNPSEGFNAAFDKYRDSLMTAPIRNRAAAHAARGSDAPPVELQFFPRLSNGTHSFTDAVPPLSLRGAAREVPHPESDYGWTRQCASPEPIHAFVGQTPTNHPHSETQVSGYIRSPSSFSTSGADVMHMHAGQLFDAVNSSLSHNDPVYIPHHHHGATNIPSSCFPSDNDQSTVGTSRAFTFRSSRLGTDQIPPVVDWDQIFAARGEDDRSPLATSACQPDVWSATNIPSPCLPTNLFDQRVSSIRPKELPSVGMHSQSGQRDCFIHRSTAPNPYSVEGPQGSSATRHPQAQLQSTHLPPHGSQARPPAHADPSPLIDPYSVHATSTGQLSWKEPLRQPPAPSWSTDSGVAFSTTHLTFALPELSPGHLELRGSSEVEPYELPQATYTQGNRKPNLDGIPDSISYGSRCRLDRLHAGDVSCVANADDVPFPLGVLSTKPSFRFRFDGYNSYDRQVNVSRVTHGRPIPPNRSRLAVLASGEMKRFLKQCETEMKQCKTEMKQCETEMKPFPYRMEELFLLRIDFTAKGTLQPRFGVYKH
ncbi:hypothetical protein K466DRAFT_600987 [Polyporus arcularius HHB13444]|uniref:Uncharacterized protein n=1 Tax=Polyporus arcularius HHB13444 TaxID=1314778 RepID=A0A5C3P8P5_9APHY|nr:hypothetical protein K466DRAFT_600987 [Polyporus arcularius HHB13444]